MGYIYEINVNVTIFSSTHTHLNRSKERDTEKVNGWCVVGTKTHPIVSYKPLSSSEAACHSNLRLHIFEWIFNATSTPKN